jgi:hypothetical protein
MSAVAITLADFAESFEAKTNSLDVPNIHPSATRVIWWWLCYMRTAAEAERANEVAECAQRVTDKVALERQWAAESYSCARV